MNLIRSMFDKKALVPAGLLLLLSGVYELGYYGIFALPLTDIWQGALFILWYLAAGVALYILMAWCWQKRSVRAEETAAAKADKPGRLIRKKTQTAGTVDRQSLKLCIKAGSLIRAALLPVIFLILVYALLRPLYSLAARQSWLLLVVELLSAVVLIFSGPLMVTWNRAVARGQNPWTGLKRLGSERGLLNRWCFLVLVRMVLDTLCGGLFTLSFGVNAFSLATLTLFQGDPLSSAALYASAGYSGASLLFCLLGCLYAWMMASWFCHGTE